MVQDIDYRRVGEHPSSKEAKRYYSQGSSQDGAARIR